jgi:FMN reductase
MASVLVLAGSPSARSRTTALAAHVGAELAADGHDVALLDLRSLPAEALLRADTTDAVVADAVEQVRAADALVVATPVYKAAYSGLLKVFLDLLPQTALRDKVVLPLATGGTVAHVLALDYALRPVLVSLGAAHVTPGRFVLDTHVDHTSGGPVLPDPEARDCVARTTAAFRAAIDAAAPAYA